jgi:hypothetical protein
VRGIFTATATGFGVTAARTGAAGGFFLCDFFAAAGGDVSGAGAATVSGVDSALAVKHCVEEEEEEELELEELL